ncbi:MAG: sigma-54-dependent transcriptional regulator [Thermacetogeniaceae bacterium]
MGRILIVDDDRDVCNFFFYLLEPKGHEVLLAESGEKARRAFRQPLHLAILDLKLPDADGLELLKEVKSHQPSCEVIMMTGYSTVRSAVKAIQLGAFDYLEKPFSNLDALHEVINKALNKATTLMSQEAPALEEGIGSILKELEFIAGKSESMRKLLMIAKKLANKNIPILIQGETGSGKEMVARFIHAASSRASRPFMAVNCGALPESLLESTLFGHERGAFTGATNQVKGIFELAHKGTLFLDEIGDASQEIQVKLLRVLETGEVFRIGAEKPIHVDVRLMAATNKNLEELVEQRVFREDLFYRLNVVTLEVPPLRQRKEEIPDLIEHFLAKYYFPAKPPLLTPQARKALLDYHWPGNIRELRNVIAQIAALCDQPEIRLEHLPKKVLNRTEHGKRLAAAPSEDRPASPVQLFFDDLEASFDRLLRSIDITSGVDLPEFLDKFREHKLRFARALIDKALKETKGRCREAAALLHTTPRHIKYLKNEKQ